MRLEPESHSESGLQSGPESRSAPVSELLPVFYFPELQDKAAVWCTSSVFLSKNDRNGCAGFVRIYFKCKGITAVCFLHSLDSRCFCKVIVLSKIQFINDTLFVFSVRTSLSPLLIIVASEMTNILNTLPSSLVTGASTLAGLFEESSPGFSLGVSVGSGVTVGIASVLWIVTVLSAHVFFLG